MKKECLVFYLQVEAVEPSEGRLLLFSYANLCFKQPKEAKYISFTFYSISVQESCYSKIVKKVW